MHYSGKEIMQAIVIGYTDLSSKEPHRQVGVGRVGTSGSLGGLIVSTMVQHAKHVAWIPALGAIFPIFVAPPDETIITFIHPLNQNQWDLIPNTFRLGLSLE